MKAMHTKDHMAGSSLSLLDFLFENIHDEKRFDAKRETQIWPTESFGTLGQLNTS